MLHKRKAVYFYDDPYIAMGHFLIVVIDAVNQQSGSDYFDRNVDPWVTDAAGKIFSTSGSGSGYAQWQLGGLDSLFTSVDPGKAVRIAFAVDLPDDTGRVRLTIGKIVLLDFNQRYQALNAPGPKTMTLLGGGQWLARFDTAMKRCYGQPVRQLANISDLFALLSAPKPGPTRRARTSNGSWPTRSNQPSRTRPAPTCH